MTAPRVQTFGCRLNAYESAIIKNNLDQAGETNAIVVNSCAVTAEAERQVRQSIRRAKRENPTAQIIVTGCAAQIAPDRWEAMDEVDHVVGNHDKLTAASWRSIAGAGEAVIVSDIMQVRETATHMLDAFSAHTRGFLQVQQGCDHRCTFCIIPYGRGNNRSAGLGQILEAASRLVDGGCGEIVLTGVNTGDATARSTCVAATDRLGPRTAGMMQ